MAKDILKSPGVHNYTQQDVSKTISAIILEKGKWSSPNRLSIKVRFKFKHNPRGQTTWSQKSLVNYEKEWSQQ